MMDHDFLGELTRLGYAPHHYARACARLPTALKYDDARTFVYSVSRFRSEVRKCVRRSLSVEEVRPPNVSTPPPSPPPFESVFPEMRIVIYR